MTLIQWVGKSVGYRKSMSCVEYLTAHVLGNWSSGTKFIYYSYEESAYKLYKEKSHHFLSLEIK